MTEPAAEQFECVEVVITAEDPEWLANFTRNLVDDHVVACGQNIAQIRAIYRWEGGKGLRRSAGAHGKHPSIPCA
jgi:hypothetical protein